MMNNEKKKIVLHLAGILSALFVSHIKLTIERYWRLINSTLQNDVACVHDTFSNGSADIEIKMNIYSYIYI